MRDKPVTLRDVAAAAGVHPATASRALNPETQLVVSEETARRVLDAARTLGYRPNPLARSLRTRRSHTVGALIPDLNNPLFPPIVRGLEDRLAETGYVALLGNTDGDDDREQLIFEQMRSRHVDGFMLATARLRHPLLAEAARAEIPIVLVNRVAEEYNFSSVSVDNERGLRMVVGYLAGLGHKQIAHIAGPQDTSTGLSRARGYRNGMEAVGLEVTDDLVVYARSYTVKEGERCGRELIERGGDGSSRCTAVAAGNDMLAIGCCDALRSAGIQVPDAMSIVGFNDMPFIDRLQPPLTSVRFPHYQVGTEAAHLLLEQISDQNAPVKVLFLAPELVVRGSAAPPAETAGATS